MKRNSCRTRFSLLQGCVMMVLGCSPCGFAGDRLEEEFRALPMEAKSEIGPLLWLHGTESRARLEAYIDKIAESGNGCFTAESRHHKDWLGEGWYKDLAICLDAARRRNLKMWIFDEKWWPSQSIDGTVPARYAAKQLDASSVDVQGPLEFTAEGYHGERYLATIAGRLTGTNGVNGATLIDLGSCIREGRLSWRVPDGQWKIMKFSHKQASGLGQGGALSVDGASRDCVEWFIQKVYQPHYDRFKADFGKTITGFFYDEPETRGDWGTEVPAILKEWGVDWKKAYVAYKFQLTGEEQLSARYQYIEARAEAWGRTLYGGMSEWCRRRHVRSMGHFMEHHYLYKNLDFCAGDITRLQRYSDVVGMDLILKHLLPGKRPMDIYQAPKLISSTAHVFDKKDHLAMCEIFGGYSQALTYPEMKWVTDRMELGGVNFIIPHSFNPRAPYDNDYPPYFYNGGFEPRFLLYRVYADYISRLSVMLTGGRHVCPIAFLSIGNSHSAGKAVTSELLTTTLQDALYDCDWMPYGVFENEATLSGRDIRLYDERYRVLVVPPVEVIPYPTLDKVRKFFDKGGTVIGYGFLPSKSATLGKSAADMGELSNAVWGKPEKPGFSVCRTNGQGGRSYFLPGKPSVTNLAQVLSLDAGVTPGLEVIEGTTDNWLHILHRQKEGRDVFFVCNQNHEGASRRFSFQTAVPGFPEVWDPMRNEITAIPFVREGLSCKFNLVLEPSESVLIVFQRKNRVLPERRAESGRTPDLSLDVATDSEATPVVDTEIPVKPGPIVRSPVKNAVFQGRCEIPKNVELDKCRIYLETSEPVPEAAANVQVNGRYVGGFIGRPCRLDLTGKCVEGVNRIVISPFAPGQVKLAVFGLTLTTR